MPRSQEIVWSQEIVDDVDRATEYEDEAIVPIKDVSVAARVLDGTPLRQLANDVIPAPTPRDYSKTKADEKEAKVLRRLYKKTSPPHPVPAKPRGRPKKDSSWVTKKKL